MMGEIHRDAGTRFDFPGRPAADGRGESTDFFPRVRVLRNVA
jgi:hypothetical protein